MPFTNYFQRCRQQQQQRRRRPMRSSSLFLLLALGVLSPTTSNALSSVAPPKNNVIAITHASGRMGKLLALQLREDACNRYQSRIQTTEDDDDDDDTSSDEETKKNDMEEYLPRIRAIVRSDQEAYSVRCDLGGMKMVGGAAQPMPCDWLETVVVDHSKLDVSQREELLRTAFEGCKAAVLCDASHNELVWTEECSVEENENGSTEFNEDCGFRVVVPTSESRDLSKRLLEEIDATKHSTTLEHVVLRSTMGLAVSEAATAHDLYLKQQPAIPVESDVDWKALANAMGGEAVLSGPRTAETAFGLVANATSKSRKHTILRLGALTDDPGMVPLVFGRKDSILIKMLDDGTQNYKPPILSRSDAARISMMLVRSGDENNINGNANSNNDLLTIDCAWHPSYGRDSVGREEVVSAAARQNLDIRAIYFDSMWDEKYFSLSYSPR